MMNCSVTPDVTAASGLFHTGCVPPQSEVNVVPIERGQGDARHILQCNITRGGSAPPPTRTTRIIHHPSFL